jgi:hypothetical protein
MRRICCLRYTLPESWMVQNDKLLDQCRVAKARCVETNNLLNLRLGTLRRAKEKMLREQNLGPTNNFSSPHVSPEHLATPHRSPQHAISPHQRASSVILANVASVIAGC